MNIKRADFITSMKDYGDFATKGCPEVAFAGKSNVGKASMINKVTNRNKLARTSATPGKTITVNFYRLDTMRLVDLPGYGYAKLSHAEKQRFSDAIGSYLGDDRDLRLVLQLIDMRHPPTADDRQMLKALAGSEIPFVVVLTKSDKLNRKEREAQLKVFEDAFSEYEGLQYIPFSSLNGEGVDVLREILSEVTEE